MQTWNLIPKVGIESSNFQIRFEMSASEVRELLGSDCTEWYCINDAELRLCYSYSEDCIESIEFANGILFFEDVQLCSQIESGSTTTMLLLESFSSRGYSLYYLEHEGFQFCPELCIGIMSDGDAGGETDKVFDITVFEDFPEEWKPNENSMAEALAIIRQAQKEGWTKLDLSNKQLREIPIEIANLTNLEILILGGNQTKVIPDAIANLTNLKKLCIVSSPIRVIPDAIKHLTNLRELDLRGNLIQFIPDAIGNLTNLQKLDLSWNQIQKIPDAIGGLTSLTHLYLSNNEINHLPEAIENLTHLRVLHLCNNRIRDIPEAIASLTNLTHLVLYNNQIHVIPEAFANLTKLRELSLYDNPIEEIPGAIRNLTRLKTISL